MKNRFEDKEYWKAYYDKLLASNKGLVPSPFAEYIVDSGGLLNATRLIELGCGSGRDSIFFSKNGTHVVAIDQCPNVTAYLDDHENITSYADDFTNLAIVQGEELFDIVYSRFTMHSIDEAGENRTLKWAYESLKDGGAFCIEARTTKDPICGKGLDRGNNVWFYNDHHRRFIEAKKFALKMKEIGFQIELFEERNGLAIYKDEDPIVLRVIGRK